MNKIMEYTFKNAWGCEKKFDETEWVLMKLKMNSISIRILKMIM